jgi:hypothetical protein
VLATEQLKMHIPVRRSADGGAMMKLEGALFPVALPCGAGFAGVMVAAIAGASSTCKLSTVTSSKVRATLAASSYSDSGAPRPDHRP